MLNKFEKFNHMLSVWFEWIAFGALIVMGLVTFIDVVGAKAFYWHIPGSIDLVTLGLTVLVPFAAATTFILGMHIQIEFIVNRLPARAQVVIQAFAALVSLIFFILIVWRLSVLGLHLQIAREESDSIEILLFPFAYGVALGSIPVCLLLIQKLIKLLVRK